VPQPPPHPRKRGPEPIARLRAERAGGMKLEIEYYLTLLSSTALASAYRVGEVAVFRADAFHDSLAGNFIGIAKTRHGKVT